MEIIYEAQAVKQLRALGRPARSNGNGNVKVREARWRVVYPHKACMGWAAYYGEP